MSGQPNVYGSETFDLPDDLQELLERCRDGKLTKGETVPFMSAVFDGEIELSTIRRVGRNSIFVDRLVCHSTIPNYYFLEKHSAIKRTDIEHAILLIKDRGGFIKKELPHPKHDEIPIQGDEFPLWNVIEQERHHISGAVYRIKTQSDSLPSEVIFKTHPNGVFMCADSGPAQAQLFREVEVYTMLPDDVPGIACCYGVVVTKTPYPGIVMMYGEIVPNLKKYFIPIDTLFDVIPRDKVQHHLVGIVIESLGESWNTPLVDGDSGLDLSYIYNNWKSVLDGLRHLHALPVLHDDLKPSNIARSSDGTSKLFDFGISKFPHTKDKWITGVPHDEDEWQLMCKDRYGTLLFRGPERLLFQEGALFSRDIHSLGLAMLCSVAPGRLCSAEKEYNLVHFPDHDAYEDYAIDDSDLHAQLSGRYGTEYIESYNDYYNSVLSNRTQFILGHIFSETGGLPKVLQITEEFFKTLLSPDRTVHPSTVDKVIEMLDNWYESTGV